MARKNSADKKCMDPPGSCLDGKTASSKGISLSAVSTLGWVVGALGVGSGVYLILSSNRRTGTQTALATDFYNHGAGLHVSRRW